MGNLMDDAREEFARIRFDDETQLVEPTVGSSKAGSIAVHIDGAGPWALPSKVRVSPGRGVLYVLGTANRVHVLIARQGRVRELLVPLDIAARIRRERFGLTG